MADSKHMRWISHYGTETGLTQKPKDTTVDKKQPAANDADGWQQYRRWISKAPAPKAKRSGIDPSLYSWKGYRDWSDQVKRSWAREPEDES